MSPAPKISPPTARAPQRRRRALRLGTVLPTVALAALSVAAAITTSTATQATPTSRPVDFANRSPIGLSIDAYPTFGGFRARGWAFDPDAVRSPIKVYSTVDGKFANAVIASVPRSDVAKAYPGAGAAHGYTFRVPVPEGVHRVCIVAQNVKRGTNYTLRCVVKTFDYGPVGAFDTLDTRPGSLHLKGWSLDPDAVTTPVTVRITVDGVTQTTVANRSRPDVANVRTGAGPAHGFELTIPARQGAHTVCVTETNIGYGTNNSLGCRTVTLDDNPVAKLELVGQWSGKLRVRGWAFDRDRPTGALQVVTRVDNGAGVTVTAGSSRTDVAKSYPGVGASHGFDQRLAHAEGAHRVCVTVRNVGFGRDSVFACRSVTLNFTPTASLTTVTATPLGLAYTGWATDPDTTKAISVTVSLDGRAATTTTASRSGSSHSGHIFSGTYATGSGKHTVCATALNAYYGTRNSPRVCKTVTLTLGAIGRLESVGRSGSNLRLTGWAFDPDRAGSTSVSITIDRGAARTVPASSASDIAKTYPSAGTAHGFTALLPAGNGEHTVCVTAVNVGGGSDAHLGCRVVNAVHPVVPSAPRTVTATSDYNASTVSWSPPVSDGGAPWTQYVVLASPGGRRTTTSAAATSAVITGLATKTPYTFSVTAVNVAGSSTAAVSRAITTQSGPAPQTTPAPVSVSRYIRNIRGSSSAELALMRSEGATDAGRNPSNHRYLALLDIGGQNQAYSGAVLSATTRFVAYTDLVRDIQAYLDGYHSKQRSTAPVTIAVGTNNDMDVTATTGKAWAVSVVNPLARYAARYPGITIAGANDIEPGFTASFAATRSWLAGYLAATAAPFIFNGSADGCAWTVTNRGCNNGWTMAGLYTLAAGAAPTRTVNLPQVYNFTMADQWKYISLTGVNSRQPRINFGGPLTEYTACAQAGSCGSIGGSSAWARLWSDLQSLPSLRVTSLPYSTDLRIDR